MKKFGMLMLGLSLMGFTLGCGGTGEDAEPMDSAPPAGTDTDNGADDTGTDDDGSGDTTG